MKPLTTSAHNTETEAKNTATLVYALQAASFLFGITYLVAAVIAYVKRNEAKGTFFESHTRWQLRTFGFSLLWSLVGGITTVIAIGYIVLLANAIWVIYRIVVGWVNLSERKGVYQ